MLPYDTVVNGKHEPWSLLPQVPEFWLHVLESSVTLGEVLILNIWMPGLSFENEDSNNLRQRAAVK